MDGSRLFLGLILLTPYINCITYNSVTSFNGTLYRRSLAVWNDQCFYECNNDTICLYLVLQGFVYSGSMADQNHIICNMFNSSGSNVDTQTSSRYQDVPNLTYIMRAYKKNEGSVCNDTILSTLKGFSQASESPTVMYNLSTTSSEVNRLSTRKPFGTETTTSRAGTSRENTTEATSSEAKTSKASTSGPRTTNPPTFRATTSEARTSSLTTSSATSTSGATSSGTITSGDTTKPSKSTIQTTSISSSTTSKTETSTSTARTTTEMIPTKTICEKYSYIYQFKSSLTTTHSYYYDNQMRPGLICVKKMKFVSRCIVSVYPSICGMNPVVISPSADYLDYRSLDTSANTLCAWTNCMDLYSFYEYIAYSSTDKSIAVDHYYAYVDNVNSSTPDSLLEEYSPILNVQHVDQTYNKCGIYGEDYGCY